MGPDEITDDVVETLRTADRRLSRVASQSTERVLAGSADPASMSQVYAAIRGEATVADGLDALRRSLAADGIDEQMFGQIEGLFLNAALGV